MIRRTLSGAELVEKAEACLGEVFKGFEDVALRNQNKVLDAFQASCVGLRHFSPSSGYGYDDMGRDTLGEVFAKGLGTEDALVRPQLMSGTHALAVTLFGLLSPGKELLVATGKPYDTLLETIGVRGDSPGSLKSWGVSYKQIELAETGGIDVEALKRAVSSRTGVVHLQRSRGYAWRGALSVDELEGAIRIVREANSSAFVLIDNCYGEFTEPGEPVGADVLVGSLIKNPGGGIAPTGGYIAGRREALERLAERLSAPGVGREIGSYAGSYQPFYQGFFMAPHVVCQSLKTAALFAKVFEELGMRTHPKSDARRSDIIQAIRFGEPEQLVRFCRSVQSASPIDSFVVPEAWEMPGYEHKVIMAAGAFVQGASIEFSADAPMREPYTAYLQGALTYEHGKLAAIRAAEELLQP